MADTIKVNGLDYDFPPEELNLGEMCDAEEFFDVEFGSAGTSGVRMAAALLWIAIRRKDPTVTVEDIRALDPNVFSQLAGDDSPPAVTPDDATSPSAGSGVNGKDDSGSPDDGRSLTGSLGSATTSASAPMISAN